MTRVSLFGSLTERLRARRVTEKERLQLHVLLLLLSLFWASFGWRQAEGARTEAVDARAALELQLTRGAEASARGAERQVAPIIEDAVKGPTAALAAMQAQSELEDFAIAAGMKAPRISSDRAEPIAGGLQRLPIIIEGDFDWPAFERFLASLESARTSYSPAALEIFDSSTSPKFEMILEVTYLAPESVQ